MSRSYKKSPYVTDHHRKTNKKAKRIANHSFRQKVDEFNEDMPARPQHKKYTESWNICDYKFRMTRKEAIEWYNTHSQNRHRIHLIKLFPTLEDWLNYWEKCYVRK